MKITKEVGFNEIIREYRLKRGLSQSELGEWLGVSHASVSDMERGRTNRISIELFFSLLDFIVAEAFIASLPIKITNIRGGYPLKEDMLEKWEKFTKENDIPVLKVINLFEAKPTKPKKQTK